MLTELVETTELSSLQGRLRSYATHDVKIQRIDDGYVLGEYRPRTYLVPIDIVLVVDRSGSMSSEGRMTNAKEAAKMFVDLMRPGDKIGVVDFNHNAAVTYPLTEIDPEITVKTAVKNAIDDLYASGWTSIGGGLSLGHQELITKGVNSSGKADPVRIMILLSDGYENGSPFVADVLPGIISDGITVHALGIGDFADEELLLDIARQSGGIYRFATSYGIRYIFNSLLVEVYGENVVKTASGIVPSGATVEESLQVDSTIGSMTFSLIWPGSDLDLTLVQPDGGVIDPSIAAADPDISVTSGSTYEFYKVFAPQEGLWTLRIFGKSTPVAGEEYTITASAMDAMILSIDLDKTEYVTGEPIKLLASIEDSFSDAPTNPEYILGVAMQVTVADPAQNQHSFELYDDGFHGDGEANDGVYANTFSSTSLAGSYNFKVQISGINNRHGQPFTREGVLSAVVIAGPSMQVQPTHWQFDYPAYTQTTFTVSEVAGVEALNNVLFAASDLVQVDHPENIIPSSAFYFSPNGFQVPANSSTDVAASITVPGGTPVGIYQGEIYVTSGNQSITISVEVNVTTSPPGDCQPCPPGMYCTDFEIC